MSERRKPEAVLLLRKKADGARRVKIEVFSGRGFRPQQYQTLNGALVTPNNLHNFVRLRVAGRWYPRESKTLYTRRQFLRILAQEIFSEPA